jgi:hypothetical protein
VRSGRLSLGAGARRCRLTCADVNEAARLCRELHATFTNGLGLLVMKYKGQHVMRIALNNVTALTAIAFLSQGGLVLAQQSQQIKPLAGAVNTVLPLEPSNEQKATPPQKKRRLRPHHLFKTKSRSRPMNRASLEEVRDRKFGNCFSVRTRLVPLGRLLRRSGSPSLHER